MKIATLASLFLSLFLLSCHTSNKSGGKSALPDKTERPETESGDYFLLINATYENWVAGVKNGGSGTEYHFKLTVNTNETLSFDSLWVNQHALKAFVAQKDGISNKPAEYGNGDTITVRASFIKTPNKQITNVEPPINHSGAALLGYTVNNKRMYFTISEMEKIIGPNRP